MEGCHWGQARAGWRRRSARKVAGSHEKVASGQGKVAGFVSICMFCVFHIGLNGTKSRGGWPTRPWQPVAAPAVASVTSERSPLAVLTSAFVKLMRFDF